MYPRLCKQAIGSREIIKDTPNMVLVTTLVGAFGIAGVPVTLVCGVPALAIKSGRGVKNKVKKIGRRISRDSSRDSN